MCEGVCEGVVECGAVEAAVAAVGGSRLPGFAAGEPGYRRESVAVINGRIVP